ncbi:hypothetical protein T484DRAFT_1747675 [Baffinella frigidus]|nr:hypothetical protein T484DRAFT_1747675 [Cryptophyta sp. CCMP2293]
MAPRWLSIALLLAIAAAAAADDAPSLAQEEKTAAQAQEELLRLGPLASQTEDVLIMAGGKLQATKAKISDAQSRVETLRSEEASNAESIRKAQRTRADAALKVSDEQNTLRAATRLIDAARSEEQDEVNPVDLTRYTLNPFDRR